jgi:hypothetical protein
MFFSEEKNQKTFIFSAASCSVLCLGRAAGEGIKVFLLLFLQKKKILSFPRAGDFRPI